MTNQGKDVTKEYYDVSLFIHQIFLVLWSEM